MRSRLAISWTLLLLHLALFAALPQSALALTASQVYEQVKDSVVVVKAYNQKGEQVGLGSGVMIPPGDIITNYHVVKTGVRYTVGRGTKATPATLKSGDEDKDLCLLTAPGLAAKPARLGQAARLKVGEPVYAVGAPQGLELSLSEGIVSQLRGGPAPLIQTTVAISPGSSGGGLFNAKGELVGITTFQLKESQNLNFAVPVEWIGEVAGRKIRERPFEWAVPPVPKAPAATWLDRTLALQKAQDWPGLLAHCRRWTQAEPGNYLAWSWLGVVYGSLGRHQDAIEANREALRLKPDYAEAWYNLGVSYAKLGRHQDAIEANRQALRLKPDDAKAWYNLGVAYRDLGRYQDAIEAFRKVLRPKPDFAEAWHNLGFAYARLGRHQDAIEAYREALRLKPDHAGAWNNLALAYAASDNRIAALEAVKELRRYEPQKADELSNFIMQSPGAPEPGTKPKAPQNAYKKYLQNR